MKDDIDKSGQRDRAYENRSHMGRLSSLCVFAVLFLIFADMIIPLFHSIGEMAGAVITVAFFAVGVLLSRQVYNVFYRISVLKCALITILLVFLVVLTIALKMEGFF